MKTLLRILTVVLELCIVLAILIWLCSVIVNAETLHTPARRIRVKAYAYCPCKRCCGPSAPRRTKTGQWPKEGRTIAVDVKIIKLGRRVKLYKESKRRDWSVSKALGTFRTEDTGAGIVGNKIDVYMESHKKALEWGVRELVLEVPGRIIKVE